MTILVLEMQSPINHLLATVLSASVLALSSACGADTYNPPPGDTDCTDCGSDLFWACTCLNESAGPPKCFGGEQGAQSACNSYCQTQYGQNGNVDVIPCSGNQDAGTCTSWDPASNISFASGKYVMDDTWLWSIVNNPAPLWTCDNVTLVPQAGPSYGFKVANADRDELLYELGLRNNDIPLTLNGVSLENYDGALKAFATLWYAGETDYTLVVKRGVNNVTILFQVQ